MRPAQLATPKYTFSELHQNKKKKKKKEALTLEEPLGRLCWLLMKLSLCSAI